MPVHKTLHVSAFDLLHQSDDVYDDHMKVKMISDHWFIRWDADDEEQQQKRKK